MVRNHISGSTLIYKEGVGALPTPHNQAVTVGVYKQYIENAIPSHLSDYKALTIFEAVYYSADNNNFKMSVQPASGSVSAPSGNYQFNIILSEIKVPQIVVKFSLMARDTFAELSSVYTTPSPPVGYRPSLVFSSNEATLTLNEISTTDITIVVEGKASVSNGCGVDVLANSTKYTNPKFNKYVYVSINGYTK